MHPRLAALAFVSVALGAAAPAALADDQTTKASHGGGRTSTTSPDPDPAARSLRSSLLAASSPRTASVVAATAPSTTSTITAPADGATVSGVTTLTATSTAASVQFRADGVALGAPVTVSAGSASYDWSTWGAANGSHTITAADCAGTDCGTVSSVSVTVSNAAPTFTAPSDGATVSGLVALNATTAAPKLQFSVDSVPISVVTVGSGSAGTTWDSYGRANGQHQLTVANCDADNVCAPPATMNVMLDNAAPAVSSPTPGQVTQGQIALSAVAPGGAVQFQVDGNVVGSDATAPYSIPFSVSSLTEGSHSVIAQSCAVGAAACDGPASTEVLFVVKSLHPQIVAAASPFSPNGDKKFDTSRIVLRLPDTETAVYRIQDLNGTTIVGPRLLGTIAKGDHAFVWDGKSNSGGYVPSGVYRVLVSTTAKYGSSTVRGSADRLVRVDRTAPSFSHLTGANKTFYPVTDGFQDTFVPGVQVTEGSTLTLKITNSRGQVVRTLTKSAPSSTHPYEVIWNGRTAGGSLVPAGGYHFAWTATDPWANSRTISGYAVNVSLKRLVTKSTTLYKNGNGAYNYGGSASCAYGEQSTSDYVNGLWLQNDCDQYYDDFQTAAAIYNWTLPAAYRYTSIRFDSFGYSLVGPSQVGGLVYNYSTGGFDATRLQLINGDEQWRNMTAISSGSGFVSGRTLKTAIGVDDTQPGLSDYDIAQVRLSVTYQVLVLPPEEGPRHTPGAPQRLGGIGGISQARARKRLRSSCIAGRSRRARRHRGNDDNTRRLVPGFEYGRDGAVLGRRPVDHTRQGCRGGAAASAGSIIWPVACRRSDPELGSAAASGLHAARYESPRIPCPARAAVCYRGRQLVLSAQGRHGRGCNCPGTRCSGLDRRWG